MNYLAFDIGGTNTKYAVITQEGEILSKKEIKTPATYEDLVVFIAEVYSIENIDSKCIGLSCPGIFNPILNQITGSSALDYLIDKNIVDDVKDKIPHADVFIENDGNCALLGEMWKGHAQGAKDLAIIVVGSAIGGGAVTNGQLLRGAHLNAGEFGYMLLDNDPSNEVFRSLGGKGGVNGLLKFVQEHGYDIDNGKDLFNLITEDEELLSLVEPHLMYTAAGIINIQYMIDPIVTIIGGAISRNEKYIQLLNEAIAKIMKVRPLYKVYPKIVAAKNGNDANLLGIIYKCIFK